MTGTAQDVVDLALKHPELADEFRAYLTGMFGGAPGKRP